MDRLKEKFYKKSQELKSKLRKVAKEQGGVPVDQVSVGQVLGGMRGVKSMVWETSQLDPIEGIRFRGYSIPELKEKLPKVEGGKEPLPEGLFWLMLVDEMPTDDDVKWLSNEWERRRNVPQHVFDTIDSLPDSTHPMTQFTIAIMAMQNNSIFAKNYAEGMNKSEYWDATYEDTMNLIAVLPSLAAYIY